MRYWKANKKTSKVILGYMDEWPKVLKAARSMARRLGASSVVYTSSGYGRMWVSGLMFRDAEPDRKKFVRVKNTSDGWRPRANSKIGKEFEALRSDCLMAVMELIGMKMINMGDAGFHWHSPGLKVVGSIVYLTTPDYVTAKGCARISDLQFERATKRKKAVG